MYELAYILFATFIISLISFVGVICLAVKENILNKTLLILIGLSAGALMGGAFLHLLPEAVEKSTGLDIYLFVLIGFIVFFLIEKVLHWRHCHKV
jgi:zinc and cadmium transporter